MIVKFHSSRVYADAKEMWSHTSLYIVFAIQDFAAVQLLGWLPWKETRSFPCVQYHPSRTERAKIDPLLGKAKAISDCGSASGMVCWRRGKQIAAKQELERGVRLCERNSLVDTKVREEGGGDALGTDIPLQPAEDSVLEQGDAWKGPWPHGKPCLSRHPPGPVNLWRRGAQDGAVSVAPVTP